MTTYHIAYVAHQKNHSTQFAMECTQHCIISKST